jgi:beta-galactosidase
MTIAPIDLRTGQLAATNEQLFTDLSPYTIRWSLTEDAVPMAGGEIRGAELDVGPGQTLEVRVPYELPLDPTVGAEYRLDVSVALLAATLWAPSGHEVARAQFDLPVEDGAAHVVSLDEPAAVLLEERDEAVSVTGDRFSLRIDTLTGRLDSLVYDGLEVIRSPLVPNYWRAPNDQEMTIAEFRTPTTDPSLPWRGVGERWQVGTVSVVRGNGGTVEVSVTGTVTTNPIANEVTDSTQTIVYTIRGDGSVTVTSAFALSPDAPRPQVVGTILAVVPELARLNWYGRGPGESTADRKASAFFGRYSGSVEEQVTRYERPQDTANKADTRWAALTDAMGRGLLFVAESSMYFNAQPHTPDQVADKRHWYEVPAADQVVIRVDAAQEGVQGGNWDVPDRPDRYTITPERGPFEVTFCIAPLRPGDAPGLHARRRQRRRLAGRRVGIENG